MRTHWLREFLLDLHAYLWAPFAGVVAGMAFGWVVGVVVALSFAGLLFCIGLVAHKVIAKSRETKVPQRRPVQRRSP